jgi:selenide,water dikinase
MIAEEVRLTQFSKGGGCGCKIAPSVLQEIVQSSNSGFFQNLLVGNHTSDDAAVFQINGDQAIISTTDFFVPIVDDPFDFGRIAAANSISDVYAMGGTPLMAIAILGFPIDKLPVEIGHQMMEGGRSICSAAGIPLAGGHTIDSTDPIFGLAVTGTVAIPHLKRNIGAQPGDLLYLTKPLGSGLLSTALKRGVLEKDHYSELIQHLTTLNQIGELLGKEEGVHAMTDITGFGILGHAIEMAGGSGVSIELEYEKLPKMTGLDNYLKQRTIPDATYRNWNSYSSKVQFEKGVNVMEAFTLLPDPQTNGGLLFAIAPETRDVIERLLTQNGLGDFATPIGSVLQQQEKTILVR